MPPISIPIAIPAPPSTLALLDRLHAHSEAQSYDASLPPDSAAFRAAVADKSVALDRDKAAFMYALVRAVKATYIVEAGTSYGVSTIYLALAARANAPTAVVVGTEHEDVKAAQALRHFVQAGVEGVVDLRVGDLRETLTFERGRREVDFMLLDIWTPMALPALRLVEPYFAPGAVILVDNSVKAAAGYAGLFAYVDAGPYERVTLPYAGGLEMITFQPKK